MRSMPPALRLLLGILLAPVLLAGLGAWERTRAQGSIAEYAVMQRELPQQVQALRELAVRDRFASVDLGGETRYAPALAADMLEETIPSVGRSLFLARLQVPLSWAVIGGALLALAAGIAGLLAARAAARRAMVSRDALVESFARLQRALPLILGAMVIGSSLALVCATAFEMISLWSSVSLNGGSMRLILLAVVLAGTAVAIAWSAVRALREVVALYTPEPAEVHGRALTEAEAPALWHFVRDIARRQGAAPPDTMVLGLLHGFYVTEQELQLLPEDSRVTGRTLYLPAPYLQLLNEGEVAAIVGHELAHFAGEDTAYSSRFAPLYAGMGRALAAMRADANGLLLLRGPLLLADHMMERFDHSVQHWSRLREFEADRLGAAVSGQRSAASALVRSIVIGPPVNAVLDQAFDNPPEDDPDLVAAAARLVEEQGWPDVATHLADAQSHPTDTHPSTSDRVRRLDVELDETLLQTALRPPREATSAGDRLIDGWQDWCDRLSADYLAATREAHSRHRRFLEETAAAVPREAVTLYNNVGPMAAVLLGAAGLFLAAGVAIWVYRQPLGFANDPFAIRLLLGTCGFAVLMCVVGATLIRRSGRTPLMILTAETVSSPKLSHPIAWRDVEGWGVAYGGRFGLDLVLEEGVALPRAQWFARGTKVVTAKRLVTIAGYGVKGMRVDAFRQLIERYLQADHARRALCEP